ncbi:hypothetical protein [Thermococcus peptonophilus]|uniref:hypothetical protein n=1 Tax=Thermococcus peptonophilus TaxID=53952 RepID=UPI0034669E92
MNLEITPRMFPEEKKGLLNGTVLYSGINASSFLLFRKNVRLDVNEIKLDGNSTPFLQAFTLTIPLTEVRPPDSAELRYTGGDYMKVRKVIPMGGSTSRVVSSGGIQHF